jgi:hypothetical protein
MWLIALLLLAFLAVLALADGRRRSDAENDPLDVDLWDWWRGVYCHHRRP